MAFTYSPPAALFLGTVAGCLVPVAQALPYHTIVSRIVDGNVSSTLTSATYPSSEYTSPSNASTSSLSLAETSTDNSPSDQSNQIPGLVAASILFVVFMLLFICVYFFGTSLRRRIDAKPSKGKPLVGLGFGFDGLTKAELKALRLKEESNEKSGHWFVRLPERPPALALRQDIPLPPIVLHMDEKHEHASEADIRRVTEN